MEDLREELFSLLQYAEEDKIQYETAHRGFVFKPTTSFYLLVLGLSERFDDETARRSARLRYRAVHPDRCSDERAVRATQLIRDACEHISALGNNNIVIDLTECTSDSDSDIIDLETETPNTSNTSTQPQESNAEQFSSRQFRVEEVSLHKNTVFTSFEQAWGLISEFAKVRGPLRHGMPVFLLCRILCPRTNISSPSPLM
jgi:hypothetical protein